MKAEQTRPFSSDEQRWAAVFGASLTCQSKECENEATHIRIFRFGPGMTREDMICGACAKTETNHVHQATKTKWICTGCGSPVSIDALRCWRCGSTVYRPVKEAK